MSKDQQLVMNDQWKAEIKGMIIDVLMSGPAISKDQMLRTIMFKLKGKANPTEVKKVIDLMY